MRERGTPFRYLFVVGCPRSGTTALAWLLAHHPSIVIGIERYGSRFTSPSFLDPTLFERRRFYTLEPGDTFYSKLPPLLLETEHRFEAALYRGDKLPLLHGYLPRLFAAFGAQVRVLFLVRNPVDVAASFEARAADPDDKTWTHGGAENAIDHWSRATRNAVPYLGDKRVYFIEYESLFQAGVGLEALAKFLEIPLAEPFRIRYQQVLASSTTREAARSGRRLDWRLLQLIFNETPIVEYRQILDCATAQRA